LDLISTTNWINKVLYLSGLIWNKSKNDDDDDDDDDDDLI
jgi:hypothetical protein